MPRVLRLPPRWLRRATSVLLVLEGVYVAGLLVLLGSVADGAAALDGRATSGFLQPVSWGVALTTAAAMIAAAVVLWRHPRLTNPFSRVLLAAVAGVHFLVLIGAVIGLGAVVIGGMGSEEPALAGLWYLVALVAAAAVSATAGPVAVRSTRGS